MIKLKALVNSYRNNQDTKILAKNFLFLSLLKGVSLVVPLITLPYLTRVIGVEKFGILAFTSAIMIFIETITNWGFDFTAVRDVAKNRGNKEIVSQIVSEVLFSKLVIMLISFLVLVSAIYMIDSLKRYSVVLVFTFLYIPGHILFPDWLFQAYEDMKYITLLNVLSKIIFTVLIFVVIRDSSDYLYQPLLTACGYIVSGIIALYIIVHKYGVHLYKPTFRCMFCRLKNSTNMFISLILPNLYTNLSTILLSTNYGATATGIYAGGQRFQSIVDQLTQVLSRTFFPFLARNIDKHYLYVRISGMVSIMSCLLLFFGANLITDLFYTSEFNESATVLRIFAISPFFLFLMNAYGTNYLVIVGKENILRNIIVLCSVLGCLLTWIFTLRYGYIGAASTITIVWGIRGLLTYYFSHKIQKTL